jgi:hypothetical protein
VCPRNGSSSYDAEAEPLRHVTPEH